LAQLEVEGCAELTGAKRTRHDDISELLAEKNKMEAHQHAELESLRRSYEEAKGKARRCYDERKAELSREHKGAQSALKNQHAEQQNMLERKAKLPGCSQVERVGKAPNRSTSICKNNVA